MKKLRIIIVLLMALIMLIVMYSRPQLVFGGENLMFCGYLGWTIYANITGVEL